LYEISPDYKGLIKTTYFSFTTFSTVGFGDYHPKSDFERIICTFALLFGVAIFSYVMGNFTDMLNKIKRFNMDQMVQTEQELS
jgi:hypothetical protein